jgi:ribosomal protein L25 (general stress protein Ctc)
MKNPKRGVKGHSAARRTRVFRAGVFACVLLGAGVATAVATMSGSPRVEPARDAQNVAAAPAPAEGSFVTVEVGGKKVRVNAQTLQQGPLTQEQSQQVADALEGNKSTEGLAQVKQADGTIEVDLQDRFQNVTIARRNDDGTVSAACVDTPEAAREFLRNKEVTTTVTATRPNGKAAAQE